MTIDINFTMILMGLILAVYGFVSYSFGIRRGIRDFGSLLIDMKVFPNEEALQTKLNDYFSSDDS